MAQICKLPKNPQKAAALIGDIDHLLASELFRALSDPTRNKILACICKCGRPCSVSEVAECCNVDFSVVSRHLAVLAAAGVLESAKLGRIVSYSVRFQSIMQNLRDLAQAFEDCSKGRSKLVSIRKEKIK